VYHPFIPLTLGRSSPCGLKKRPICTVRVCQDFILTCNDIPIFPQFMDLVMYGFSFAYAFIIYDILIASSFPEQHIKDLQAVFQHLESYGIIINLNKCILDATNPIFLDTILPSKEFLPYPRRYKQFKLFFNQNRKDNFVNSFALNIFIIIFCLTVPTSCTLNILSSRASQNHSAGLRGL